MPVVRLRRQFPASAPANAVADSAKSAFIRLGLTMAMAISTRDSLSQFQPSQAGCHPLPATLPWTPRQLISISAVAGAVDENVLDPCTYSAFRERCCRVKLAILLALGLAVAG
jgi:hypothetical protein